MRGGKGEGGAGPELAAAAEGSGRAMNYQQQLANSAAIRAEIQRFESVHPNIYSIYELLERVEEPVLQNQIREHVIAIEGEPAAPVRRGGGQAAGGARGASGSLPSPSPWTRGTRWLLGAAARPLQVAFPSSISPWQCFLRGVRGSISARTPLVPLRWMPGVAPRRGVFPSGRWDPGEHGWNGEKLFCYLPGAVVQAGQR